MDPSSFFSPPTPVPNAVPFAVEANNHPPPPPPPSQPPPNHPPYAQMIYAAIEALKEENGSSKRAISKYIEQVYKDQIPESHTELLTHHLKRLKSEGLLHMIKNSYIIPRSTHSTQPTPSSKPRGRPRKAQAQAQPQVNLIPQQTTLAVDNNNSNAQSQIQQNAEPVWAALGLSDEPLPVQSDEVSKKRPGRPKKVAGPGPSQGEGTVTVTQSRGRGRPPGSKSKSKRKPGRPPRIIPETEKVASAAAVVSGGLKRRPGRPAKNQQQNPTPIPFAAPAVDAVVEVPVQAAVEGGAILTPRSRGRPRRYTSAAVPVAGRGRGRGRGRGSGGRGRGRGGGGIVPQATPEGKRPRGRPKKGTTPASASAPKNAAYEDQRRKLEHFQGKVKESLAVLRPHFNHESPVTAIAAIQELEILVAMDLNEPLKDETLPQQPNEPAQDQQQPPPPPQQQAPPQQHLPPQQVVAQPHVFPQHPAFHMQEYQYQPHQLYQQPPPQQLFQQPPPQQLFQQPPPQQLYQQPPPQQDQFHP